MLQVVLMLSIILLYSFQTLFVKMFSDRYGEDGDLATSVFCVLESVSIVVISLAFNGFRFHISPITFLIGVLNAATLFTYNVSLVKAGQRGSYAFMNVVMVFGCIVIPLIYSVAFLHQTLGVLQYIAIALMLVSFALVNGIKTGGAKLSYYVFCLLLSISNGVYSTLVKVQEQVDNTQSKEMIIVTFGIMGVIAAVQLVIKQRGNTLKAFKVKGSALVFLILSLLAAGLAINMLLLIIPLINVAVLYTIENGGVLLLSTVYSIVLFKEKMTATKIFGILLAIVCVTVLSI